MAAARDLKKGTTKKIKNSVIERVSLKNTFWKSTLFNEIYLDQDIYRNQPEKWDVDGDPEFEVYINSLLNLFIECPEEQAKGWNEAQTVSLWIKPILEALGWVDEKKQSILPYAEQNTLSVEKNGQTYIPDLLIADTIEDMALFDDKSLSSLERLEKAKGKVLIPLEAKYWNRINKQYSGKLNKKEEKEKARESDAANRLGPNGQTLKYMEVLELEWGMLSDGATWRLFNKELSTESEGRYLEFNLYNLYKRAKLAVDNEKDSEIFREAAKFFYNFFSKKALFPVEKKRELVRKALIDSKSYADDVEEDLKERFVDAMNIVCNGLKRASGKKSNIEMIRAVAENHLFNILFIKSCEARNILPLDAPKYWDDSLSKIIDALHAFDPDDYLKSRKSVVNKLNESFYWFDFTESGTELFDSLIKLSNMIHKGTNGTGKGFHIDGFRESVFNKDEWKFAKENKLTNIEMIRALFQLGFSKAPKGSPRKYQEIPYQYFTPRQLGSIYESFLEYKLELASEDLAYVKNQWKPANLNSSKVINMDVPKVKKGHLFFTPDNKDRKATGSYYTPDYIVQNLIKNTLGPICDGKSSKEILEIRICDPAMGSGHFLNGSLNYLTIKYLEALEEEVLDDITLTPEEAKRIVLDKCIFGIDINPRAVKLACMSLWLESAHTGKKLERLDDQLFCGDSLELKEKFPHNLPALSAILGNPPYGIDFSDDEKNTIFSDFSDYSKRLDSFQLFIEKIYSHDFYKQKDDFSFGFIIPNTFLTLDAFSSSREKIVNEFNDIKIVNFDYQVFSDATIDSCLIVCQNTSSTGKIKYSLCPSPQNLPNCSNEILDRTAVNITNKFKLIPAVDMGFLGTINKKVSDHFDVCTGVKAYQVGKGVPAQTPEMRDNKVYSSTKKKGNSYLPFLYGRDIKQFAVNWQTGEYIKYGKNLAEPKEARYHNQDRIFVQRIRNPKLKQRLVAAKSNGDEIASAGLSIIVPNKDHQNMNISLEALTVYLNLPLVNDWYASNFKDVNVKPTQIREIPIELDWLKPNSFLHSSYKGLVKLIASGNEEKFQDKLNEINATFVSDIIGKQKQAA